MDSKQKVTIIIAVIGLLTAGTAGSMALNIGNILDFSTNIGQIGDNVVNNYVRDNFGIDVEKFKENCDAGDYIGKEAQSYCELIT